MSTSRTAFRTLTFLAMCLISIPAAELSFRMMGDQVSPDLEGLFKPFADGSYKLHPNRDTYAFYAAGRVSVHTDELGLRCDEQRTFAVRPGDSIDVLVMGDSQGFGNGVNYESTIAGTLAQIGKRQGYRVANASVGGHSLEDQFQVVRWLVEERKLKIANLLVLLNPVMIGSPNQPSRVTVGEDGRLYSGPVSNAARLRLWVKTHSVVHSRLRDAIRSLGIGTQPSEPAEVLEFYRTGQHKKSGIDELLKGLEKVQAFALRHRAAVHLAYIPLIIEADFDQVRQTAAASGIPVDPDASVQIGSVVAERLQVSWFNLKPVMGKIRLAGHPLNVMGDFHYSPELSEASGAKLARLLSHILKKDDTKEVK